MMNDEAEHCLNDRCLPGLVCVRAGERLEQDPGTDEATNCAMAEKFMKEAFHHHERVMKKLEPGQNIRIVIPRLRHSMLGMMGRVWI